MKEKNLGAHRFSACWAALAFLVVGLFVLSPLVFAQVEKSPVVTPKTPTPKATVPSPEKVVTPSTKLAPGEKVNINTATKEKLGALPGIGPSKAQGIIDGRPYAKPEDIMKVKGIKKGTYDKLKELITLQ
jgi:competence protein ComEA